VLNGLLGVVGVLAVDRRPLDDLGNLLADRVTIREPPANVRLGHPGEQGRFQRLGVGEQDIEAADFLRFLSGFYGGVVSHRLGNLSLTAR
jgi:hypothetical protein